MPRLLVTFLRPEAVSSELVERLREHAPVEVRTVYRRPSRRPGAFKPLTKRRLLVVEALFFLRYLALPRLYRPDWRFVIRNGHYATLLFARLLRLFGQRRRVYLLNFYLHELGRSSLVEKALHFLFTPDVHVLAQTRSEERYFQRFLPEENVRYVPYCQGESRHVMLADAAIGDYVFAGGMVNRDYDALLRCAADLPEIPFVVVASAVNKITQPVPPNVTLRRDEPPKEFDRLVARSRLVVIPLKEDVGSSGQMVLLKAMSLGKTVAMPRVGAIVDYVEADRSGVLYELGDDDALKAAVASLYDDRSRLAEIGAAARQAYLADFTPARYMCEVAALVCAEG